MTDARRELDALVLAVETWQAKRVSLSQEFKLDGFRKFCEVMNYHTRQVISAMGKNDPEFFSALAEIATNAQTLITKGAKLRADGIDRTQV